MILMIFCVVIFSFLITFFSLKLILLLIREKGIKVRDDEKEPLKDPRPRFGGVGIFAGFSAGIFFVTLLSNFSSGFQVIPGFNLYMVTLLGVFLLGLADDIYGLNALHKLPFEIAISTLLFANGFAIKVVSLPFAEGKLVLPFLFSYIITVLWITGIMNAVNLIDGVDGLAGGIGLITSISFIFISYINQRPEFALLAIIMIGPLLAFLIYNFYPSKIYMGDSGSLVIGFFLATLSLKASFKASFGVSLIVPVLVLLIPISDTVLSIVRRLLKGSSPFKPDLDHLHHKLLKNGNNEKKVFFIIISWTLLFSIIGVLTAFVPKYIRIIFVGSAILFGLIFLVYLRYLHFDLFGKLTKLLDRVIHNSD